jgi:hypothetical protein
MIKAVMAYAWNSNSRGWQSVGDSSTNASGQYDLGGLAAGTYRVCFYSWTYSANYSDECYNNTATVDSATDIAVTAGATTAGIDAQLAIGGHITGTVRDSAATSMPIGGVSVTAYISVTPSIVAPDISVTPSIWDSSRDYWLPVRYSSTNPSGQYDIGGLATGTYRVCFSYPNYIIECYNNVANASSATDIAVTAGATTAGIDAQLAIGDHITGTVRDSAATPRPISWASVNAYAWNSSYNIWQWVSGDGTDSFGQYDLGGLATGTYRVCFSYPDYIDECYNNAANVDSATDIGVTPGATTAGIDAQLAIDGHITGTVRDSAATPMPIHRASVDAYAWNSSYNYWQWVRSGGTDSFGQYDLGGLATGTYRVCFSSLYYAFECYNNVAIVDSAADIAVTAGVTTDGIDAQLTVEGHITGTVRDSTATPMPISGVFVTAYTNNSSYSAWQSVGGSRTSASGQYDIGGLATGTYRVCFSSANYASECYNNVAIVESATDIAVTAGATTAGIDAQLAIDGHITGTVRDNAPTPMPINGVFVRAYAWNSRYSVWQQVRYSTTNPSGQYDIGGLATSTYRLCFSSLNYAYECYNNAANVDSATDIAVTTGATTTGIDAQLAIGGHITGTVLDSAVPPMPISGVAVSAYAWNSSSNYWQWVRGSSTNPSGQYDLGGLAADTYRVCFSSVNSINECYNNVANVDSATDIVVTAGATTAGIDAQLVIGGHITGTVRNSAVPPMPISGVAVSAYAWNSSSNYWQWVRGSRTNPSGQYDLGGLATGTYRVCFSSVNSYAYECYNNVAIVDSATDIAVTAGATTAGIDAQLTVAGRITGTVLGSATLTPINGVVFVTAYANNSSYSAWQSVGGSYTSPSGHYGIGLATGTYRVCFSSANYASECYNNVAIVESATDIAVTAGATTAGIDAQLTGEGHITGTVRDSSATPMPINGVFVSAYAWNSSNNVWQPVRYSATNPSGQYDIGGLATRTYRLCFSSLNYAYECYNNAANVHSATDIVATAGATVSGINAQLQSPANCQTGPWTINGETFAAGTHTRASQTSIATQGTVTVQTGANVTFRAPLHRYGPGLRIASGAVFRAQAGTVTCSAASATPATTATPTAARAPMTTAPATAPLPFTGMDDLPAWVQEWLAARGIDRPAMAQALLDPHEQWLLFETPQGLDPGDRNATSDIYRLDLLNGSLTLLSRTPLGTAGNGPSRYPAAEALGDWVAFQSEADDLASDDDNGVSDIFLHEVALGQTRRITATADQASAHPALDAAGQDLLYDQQDGDGRRQVLADTLWGSTAATSLGLGQDGTGAPLDRHHPAISADGRFVAYLSGESGAAWSDTCQVHYYDRDRGRSGAQPCPAELTATHDTARPQFSTDSTQLDWYLPGETNPVRLENPLMAVSTAITR